VIRSLMALALWAGTAAMAAAQLPPTIATADAPGAVLRGLDTANGQITDITIKSGETKRYERLEITLDQCRYPQENPAGDAFAHLKIRDVREIKPRFDGWMIASSPALSALDHPRYDVWVLRCQIDGLKGVTADPSQDQDPAPTPKIDPEAPAD